jgi:hypothetical protein
VPKLIAAFEAELEAALAEEERLRVRLGRCLAEQRLQGIADQQRGSSGRPVT